MEQMQEEEEAAAAAEIYMDYRKVSQKRNHLGRFSCSLNVLNTALNLTLRASMTSSSVSTVAAMSHLRRRALMQRGGVNHSSSSCCSSSSEAELHEAATFQNRRKELLFIK